MINCGTWKSQINKHCRCIYLSIKNAINVDVIPCWSLHILCISFVICTVMYKWRHCRFFGNISVCNIGLTALNYTCLLFLGDGVVCTCGQRWQWQIWIVRLFRTGQQKPWNNSPDRLCEIIPELFGDIKEGTDETTSKWSWFRSRNTDLLFSFLGIWDQTSDV